MSDKSSSTQPLVVGIGSEIMGDDAVGLRVLEAVKQRNIERSVAFKSLGSDGFRILAHLCDRSCAIIIDALTDVPAGSVHTLSRTDIADENLGHSLHNLTLSHILSIGERLYEDRFPEHLSLVGIGVASVEIRTKLSETVAQAIPEAADVVSRLLTNQYPCRSDVIGECA